MKLQKTNQQFSASYLASYLADNQPKLLLSTRNSLTTALATSRQILFEAPATVFRYAREGRARWLRELGLRHRYEDRRQCARERHVRQGWAPALLTKTQAPRSVCNAMLTCCAVHLAELGRPAPQPEPQKSPGDREI